MPQETAKIADMPEHSPVQHMRERLQMALEHLAASVQTRMEEAARMEAAARAASEQQSGDSEQWRNACHMLETQLAQLKDENSQLHSEIHHLREQAAEMKSRNARLEEARDAATAALDEAITSIEKMLQEA